MSEPSFDIDPIVTPIPGDNPAGEDPRVDPSPVSPFRQVKDKREEARRAERQALASGEESAESITHWRAVRGMGLELLAQQAKDLEVGACILEALMRLEGPAGLADGFILNRLLVENFWGQLYPARDEDDAFEYESTLLPLSRLDGEALTNAMQHWQITQGTSQGPFVIWQHRQALELQNLSDEEREERIRRGATSMDNIDRAVLETDPNYFLEVYNELNRARDELQALVKALDERCPEAPAFRRVDEGLEECLAAVRLVGGDRLDTLLHPPEEVLDEGGESGSGGGGAAGSVDTALKSRDDAFRALNRIADFFEKIEPQSLLPAEIRKVVRRGRMNPEELYRDLIMDDSVLERLFRDVGLTFTQDEYQ